MLSIEVHNLQKRFGDLAAVQGVSFGVEEGSIFAFLGPNGAGKTTTIRMLTTLLKPTEGTILLNGVDPVHHEDEARKLFGIVFQDPSIDEELTAYENMDLHGVLYRMSRVLRAERIKQLMNVVELWDRKDEIVKHFSGGMRRRLEIARGLIHHPKILFLDEPTIGLDPQTRNHIWSYVKGLNKEEGITVFLTTHYMEEADRVADYVAVIDHGAIVAQDTPEGLKQKTGVASLEDAFLSLTGKSIREESAGSIDQMRMHARVWRR
ncbi:MAG: ATP-binding cassette domain-containing protein [Patescibacteria group bacterium]|nr:ATP-binding cassette domain-containing protein [Patescibacteria group bacterium]MDE2438334.1 ATP-binding cassette domain-containing protein [Patescibacteria group bacterium]